MSNDFWSTLNKKKREELLRSTQTRDSSSVSKTSKASEELQTGDFWSVLNEDKKRELLASTTDSAPTRTFMDDDDIAPVFSSGEKDTSQTVETTQAIFDKYGKYYNSADYDEYSKRGAAIENPSYSEALSKIVLFGNHIGNKAVVNKATFGRENAEHFESLKDVAGFDNAGIENWKVEYLFMTDFEVGIYNYLLAKEGEGAAQEFLDDIEETLSARRGAKSAERIETTDNSFVKALQYAATSVASGGESFVNGLEQLFSEEALPTTSMEFMNQELLSDLDGFAKQLYSAGHTVGNMAIPTVAGFVSPAVGRVLQSSSAAGNAYRDALKEGKDKDEAATYGVMIGSLDFVTSKLLSGIEGTTGNIPQKAMRGIGTFKNALLRTGAKYAVNIASEITEEELQLWLEPAVRSIAFGEGYDAPTIEEMAETAIVTALSTGILNSSTDIATGNLTKVEGLTANEARVVEKVYEQRLAEESENKTLTNRDKNKLRERVIEEMKRGYVSTDEIESVLGGKTYEEYKSLTDKQTSLESRKKAIEDEIKSLVKTPESQFTVEQRERLTSLREEARGIKESLQNLGIKTAKNKLFNEVDKLTSKDTYLRESYNDLIRQRQDIQIDDTQYNGTKFADAAKKTVENARKAGASNSSRVRDFVEFSAKYSSVSGTVVDFKDDNQIKQILENQLKAEIATLQKSTAEADKTKLAEMQDMLKQVQEGKIRVNGVKTKDGVAINIKSPNYLNTVLGHEVTHFLEGKNAYEPLQKAIFKYAQSKGDFEGRRKVLETLYKNIDGTSVDYELTADLVGDYLFTEYDFIKNLSTENRNVFQYVYDQIKYMYKLATAGSKEARELEKVMHQFEKALRESAETSQSLEHNEGATQFSLRTKPAPKKTQEVYKLMRLKDGEIYPLFIDSTEPLKVGEWYDADSPNLNFLKEMPSGVFLVDANNGTYQSFDEYLQESGERKTKYPSKNAIEKATAEGKRWVYIEDTAKAQKRFDGETRKYWNIGINGSGSVSTFSMRPGYHAGSLPTMRQIGKGANRDLRDDSFVWTVGEVPADIDYQAEAEMNPDKDIPTHIPEDGYYLKATNADKAKSQADRVGWYVAGSYKINRLISDSEARQVIDNWNAEHPDTPVEYDYDRESGMDFDAEQMKLVPKSDTKYSLSKDIENFDNSWYNEIEISSAERNVVQSEALTWHANKKNQLITQTLSNEITYRYMIDDDGIAHIYGRKKSVNIHDWKEDYGNTNTTRSDSVVEELWLGQGNNGIGSGFSRDGRKQGKDDTNDNNFVSGEGRSNGTGYSKDRTYANGKPKGWHFNDDGSVEVTYRDGTKELENTAPIKEVSSTGDAFFDGENPSHSLSTEGEKRTLGGSYRFDGKDFRVKSEQDVAPVPETAATVSEAPTVAENAATPKSTRIADGTRGEELLVESLDNYPMKTVEQKIAEGIRAIEGELADNRDLRIEAETDYNSRIEELRRRYNSKKNKNSQVAYGLLQSISRLERLKASTDAKFAKRISDLEARAEKMKDPQYSRAMYKKAKMEEHAKFAENLIGDTSTWVDKKLGLQYETNTERRNLRDIVRDENGKADIERADAINDALSGQYNRNQAERNRKDNEISKKYLDLKVNRHESVYANMLGELKYNPETTLTEKAVNEYYEKHKNKIDTEKVDKFIGFVRSDLDYFFETLNAKLREQGMKEIPYRKGYFPHKVYPKQNFIQKLLNWKTQDTEIPTSIAGLTEDFKPVKSYQSFDKQRHTDDTDYDLMRLFQDYKNGALDWIYHLEDIQKRRAVENYIRYTHSEEGIQERIKAVYANEDLDADQAQAEIENILKEAKNPLHNFVQDFTTHTNILAGKKNSLDRAIEQKTNRQIYSVMQNVQNRTSANMVLANVRSALTNFIPITQSWAQVSPLRSLQAAKDTIANSIKDDGLINKSTFLTNRLREADSLYKTNWDKILDKAGIMFEIVDNFSSQVIWRSKYNQNLSNGMSEAEAIANADQFAENVMAGRSKGNEPTLFNAKNPLVKAFTMFQLEVNNQYGYLFKDVPNDLKAETNHWKLNLAKGYTTAFIGAYVYNALLEKVTGSDAALDPIGIIEDLLRDLGLFGDDEEKEPEDAIMDFGQNVAQQLPFVGGLLGGGRIPISSAIPYGGEYSGGIAQAGKDVMSAVGAVFDSVTGDEADWSGAQNLGKELMNPILNVGLPVGGGQIKKTYQGLNMFSDEHPVSGSYTDSGSLRFPVEDTPLNRLQAGIFGQYASENAREYFDNDYAPLKEKQIQEYIDVDMPIKDYWEYREGLNDLAPLPGKTSVTTEQKVDYIDSLDLPTYKKNILVNNVVNRKEPIDMTSYGDYGSLEEFDFATKSPDKYALAKSVGGYSAYAKYSDELYDIKSDKDANGKSISGSRKEKVVEYINNLDADYYTKIILFKSEYPSSDEYNMEIIEYINGRNDLTYDERVAIYRELGFTVSNGYVHWD